MLEVTGSGPSSEKAQDWSGVWNSSEEREAVRHDLARMKEDFGQQPPSATATSDSDALRAFAATFGTQIWVVQKRVFQQYWRTPSYLFSKLCLVRSLRRFT